MTIDLYNIFSLKSKMFEQNKNWYLKCKCASPNSSLHQCRYTKRVTLGFQHKNNSATHLITGKLKGDNKHLAQVHSTHTIMQIVVKRK